MQLFKIFLRICCGLVFLLSAYFKFQVINAFEIYTYSVLPFNMMMAYTGARLLIGLEAFIGLFLVFGFSFNIIRKVAFLLLSLFSLFLIVQMISGGSENCFCFGEALPMQPAESLIKNLILLGILIYLRKHNPAVFIKNTMIYVIIFIGILSTPFIISPIDSWTPGRYIQYGEFNAQAIEEELRSDTYADIPLHTGKMIVCYFSMSCEYCRLTAEKLSAISEKTGIEDQILYIFFGEEKNLPMFWDKSHSKKFSHYLIDVNSFFKASGPGLPAVYFLEDGKPVKKFGYRTLDDRAIEEFLLK